MMDILNGRYWVFDDWIEGGSRGAVKDGFHELASCRDKNGSLSCLKSKAQAILLACLVSNYSQEHPSERGKST